MRIISIVLLLVTLTISGCDGTNKNSNSNNNANGNGNSNRGSMLSPPPPLKPEGTPDPKFKTCNAYFPLVPGSTAKYVINYSSGIVADLTIVVDAADEGGRRVYTQKSQLIDRSGGMQIIQTTVRKFVCDAERVQILSEKTDSSITGQSSSSEFEYRDNSLAMVDPKALLTKGTTWSHGFRTIFHSPGQPPSRSDQPTIINFEVLGPTDVTTALGTFKTISILRKVGENATTDFYAPGLGLIKRQAKEGTTWELISYSGLKVQSE